MTDRHLTIAPPPGDTTPTPHDPAAEQATLGALLTGDRTVLHDITTTLNPADFWHPRHEAIYQAILHLYARLEPVDPITVADHLRDTGHLTKIGGPATLHELLTTCPAPANGAYYADIVADTARRRRTLTAAQRITAAALTPGADLDTILTTAHTELDQIHTTIPGVDTPSTTHGQDIDDFLADDDEGYDWLIPGLLEKQDRVILTAAEGAGKSTLLRQIGIQVAAGIHPFTGTPITPIKVLYVDLENSARQSRRKLRPLRHQAGHRLTRGHLTIECKVDGLALNNPDDEAWLDRIITEHNPDLLITGPIYKMADGDPNDERDTKPVVYALDRLRARHDLAIILEAHSRKGDGKTRPKEPFGWSGWLRWPEFGIHLADDGEITHWRGMRDERDFPHQLNRGGTWPFTAAMTLADQEWASIREAVLSAGRKLSVRAIEEATGISRSQTQRAIADHKVEWTYLVQNLVGGDDDA